MLWDPGKYFWIPMGSCILRSPGFSSQVEVTLHPRPSVLGLLQANAPYHPCPPTCAIPTPMVLLESMEIGQRRL